MRKSASPNLPESLIFQKDGLKVANTCNVNSICQKFIKVCNYIFQFSQQPPWEHALLQPLWSYFFTIQWRSKRSKNLCFGKENILLRSAVYHKTNIKT